MIHSDKGRVAIQGKSDQLVDELTFAMVAILESRAKCRDRKKLMNIGMNITKNAIDILEEREKENGNGGENT